MEANKMLAENTENHDEISFPEIQELKCGVIEDQKSKAEKRVVNSVADESILKKLKYNLKYESKLDYRNSK